jgi:hypothetical protein
VIVGFAPVLPDGLFLKQKSQFGKILEGLRLENVNIFYGHLEYFTHLGYFMTICCILCSFGTFLMILVSCTKKKNLATLIGSRSEVEIKKNPSHLWRGIRTTNQTPPVASSD